ncbi:MULTISPECIES: hypothetical protein [Achromobacter]|nr:hypothetical protein [Achromobacter piechaudii]
MGQPLSACTGARRPARAHAAPGPDWHNGWRDGRPDQFQVAL